MREGKETPMKKKNAERDQRKRKEKEIFLRGNTFTFQIPHWHKPSDMAA